MHTQIFSRMIEPLTTKQFNNMTFKREYASALILTHDNKILLQLRTNMSKRFAGCIATFGGTIEAHENPLQALIRELHEELGGVVEEGEVASCGVITEALSNYTEAVHAFFWHDRKGSINGCYEGNAIYFANMQEALLHPKAMDYVQWLLQECKKKNLIA